MKLQFRGSEGGVRRALTGLVLAAGLCVSAGAWGQQEFPPGLDPDDVVEFSPTSEPVELIEIVNYIAEETGINVSVKGTITGAVMFNAQQSVPRRELLSLLEALLTQYNYSLTRDPVGIYLIQPANEITQSFEGEFATTRIIATPNIKPSSLRPVLDPSAPQTGQGTKQIAYVDDLGILVVTDTPRNVRAIERLVMEVLDQWQRKTYTRIDLKYVAAAAARDRAVTLVGQARSLQTGFPGQEQQQGLPQQAASLDNLADRITIDTSGNALVFRGTEDEIQQVRDVLTIIDVPTTLTPKEYFAGAGAAMIANIASQRGLGEVIRLEDTGTQENQNVFFPGNFGNNRFGNNQGQQQTSTLGGGSAMMVDPIRGTILYYGTIEQQEQLASLIDALQTDLDQFEIQRYPVRNVDAQELADLLQAIIERESGTDSPLLPGSRNQGNTGAQGVARQLLEAQAQAQGTEAGFAATADDAYVTAHEATNAVVVYAPRKLQEQFERLINEMDVRRPQVYVEAKILAVSNSVDFQLAIEGQLQAGQFATQTNFGLGSQGEGGAYTDPKLPLAGLGGYSATLIKSSYVPFIINAIQTDTDARILSSPQLLVNDNEEAEIVSLEEQPTSTTTIGQTSDQTSFNGYETAGTSLLVTPSISEAGYLRLAYEIELSNFIGTGENGLPAPKNTRNVRSDSVTIPTDTTIVVGGITVNDTRNTVVKVPLLGDIPLIGLLFRDTGKVTTEQTLYIFITPRILNDRNFADLRLLTKGPMDFAEIDVDIPDLEPSFIELVGSGLARPGATFPDDEEGAIIPLEPDAGVVHRNEGEGE